MSRYDPGDYTPSDAEIEASQQYHLTPEQVRALAAGDPGELEEAEALRECWSCGEPLGGEARAEVYYPGADERKSRLVHAEPCATDLLKEGWELA